MRMIRAHLTRELQLSQEHSGKYLKVYAVGYSHTVPLEMFSLRQHKMGVHLTARHGPPTRIDGRCLELQGLPRQGQALQRR